tara:strand:+ start:1768 stop:2289 length:522 start_codon:yes stop_codon:yes gene_type:complete
MEYKLPHQPKWSKNWIEKKLSANYFKKPYDRFMWWRSYTPKNKPLTNRHPFVDRIINGDFEVGPYLMEVELTHHSMNEKYSANTGSNGVDFGKYHSESSIDRARKKRLIQDHEKEEMRKLLDLRNEFVKEFKITKDEYDLEAIETSGTTIDFYYEVADKYGKRIRRLKTIPKV